MEGTYTVGQAIDQMGFGRFQVSNFYCKIAESFADSQLLYVKRYG